MQWYFISLLFPEILFRHALVAMIVSVFSFRDAYRKNAAKDNRRQLCHSSLRRIQRIIHSLTKHFFTFSRRALKLRSESDRRTRCHAHNHTRIHQSEEKNQKTYICENRVGEWRR